MASLCEENVEFSDEEVEGLALEVHVDGGKNKGTEGTSGANSEAPDAKKLKPTRSDVWVHYTRLVENRDKCKCNYCGKVYNCNTASGTSNLKKHLKTCKQKNAWDQRKSQQGLGSGSGANLTMVKVSDAIIREATNEMLVLGELPLAWVESLAWRHFCSRVQLCRPLSRRTISRDIVEMYVRQKTALKASIQAFKHRVSLTTDIWVAPTTSASYMVITAHFIDTNWRLKKFILGFKHVLDHKGATISHVLLDCLNECGIDKLFTITVDNATANTSALKKLKETFLLKGSRSLVLSGEYMHMRCCAHILNLIVNDGLQDVNQSVAAIRNVVVYVRSSGHRLKAFEQRVESGKMSRGSLSLDCKTRWNSTFLMLNRAIKYRLVYEKLEAEDKLYNDYFYELENGKKRMGPPLKVDWDKVECLAQFLAMFYNSTLVVSASSSVCSHECYNEIVSIERHLIAQCNHVDEEYKTRAKTMKEKFDKYWDGVENINKLLIIASVFDPRKKMKFAALCFDLLYGKGSAQSKYLFDSVSAVMGQLFDEYNLAYKQRIMTSSSSTSSSHSQVGASSHYRSNSVDHSNVAPFVDDFVGGFVKVSSVYDTLVSEEGYDDTMNELDMYLKESVENPKTNSLGAEWDILSWWRVNSPKFPVLSELARDILAMQVSSVASESSFSTSGRIVSPQRSCLNHYMIEVLMCTEQWMKSEHQLGDRGMEHMAQMIADIEDQDKLEKEFEFASQNG